MFCACERFGYLVSSLFSARLRSSSAKASLALTIPTAAQATVNDSALFIVKVY